MLAGIAGTAWLSTLTDDWNGPVPAAVSHVDKVRTVLRRHARPSRGQTASVREPARNTAAPLPPVEAAPALPSLTPIDMPSLPGSLFGRAPSGHGRVLLRLTVDGEGRAQSASVAQSSGDPALDDRAVRMALNWRFAMPPDHPAGLTGQLVMRFDE